MLRMGKVVTGGGVAAVGFLAVGLGGPALIEGMSTAVSYGLTAFGFVLLVSVFIWTLLNQGGDQETTTTQASHGHHSPNYGRVEGGVHNYFGHPQPLPAAPSTSPWDDPNFDLNNPKTWAEPSDAPVPDMELREVCDRLYDSLGGPAQLIADFEKRVDLEIKDNVRIRKLHTWGRKKANDGLDDVWSVAWQNGDFSHKKGVLTYRHPDNPTRPIRWTDLRFNRREVDKWLPPKPDYEMIVV